MDAWLQARMWLLVGVPIVIAGTLLRHYDFHAFGLVMLGSSIVLTLFSIWLICRVWPTRNQRLESKTSVAYGGVIMASILLIVSLWGNYIVLPVVTG